MGKKTFCPFLNGNCRDDCMFRVGSSSVHVDSNLRYCLIASGLIRISDRSEDILDQILMEVRKR